MALQPCVGPWPLPQFRNPMHCRKDSLDGGLGRLKAATYTQTSLPQWDSRPRTQYSSDRRQSTPQTERPLRSGYFEFINSDLTVSCESVTVCIILQLINQLPLRLRTAVTSFIQLDSPVHTRWDFIPTN
jgi:hypothetical protein